MEVVAGQDTLCQGAHMVETGDMAYHRTYLAPNEGMVNFIAVGIPVTRYPLHRSGREVLPHPAPTLGA
jgi:hypothetical protein